MRNSDHANKPHHSKQYRDDSSFNMTVQLSNIQRLQGQRKESAAALNHSERSQSFFETLSAGGQSVVDQVDDERGLRRIRNRSMTRLMAATNQNAVMQENLI